jgi:peptidoglycan/xylan/chitin deacetylase (PgdA/CDA1 family)
MCPPLPVPAVIDIPNGPGMALPASRLFAKYACGAILNLWGEAGYDVHPAWGRRCLRNRIGNGSQRDLLRRRHRAGSAAASDQRSGRGKGRRSPTGVGGGGLRRSPVPGRSVAVVGRHAGLDGGRFGAAYWVNRIIRLAEREGGALRHPVVLMHNQPIGNPATVAALPVIIRFFRAHGYRFVKL